MIAQPKETNMTNFMTSRSAIAVAALMTLGALSFSSMEAQAGSSPTSLGNCRAFNKEGVVKCCETYVEKYGIPAFFYSNNSSCQTAVRCSGKYGKGKSRSCYIWTRNQQDERGGNEQKQNEQRGPKDSPGLK
jgi:hypothetical protein